MSNPTEMIGPFVGYSIQYTKGTEYGPKMFLMVLLLLLLLLIIMMMIIIIIVLRQTLKSISYLRY